MSTLLEKPVRVSRTITTTTNQARAIEDPARAKVLEILYRKELSAEQILNELKKSGYKKALTTMRHHLDILKESGLIEIVRIEEARGAITKFYGTSTAMYFAA
jgi:Fe2+ or Zn2+ uptake regulation protein